MERSIQIVDFYISEVEPLDLCDMFDGKTSRTGITEHGAVAMFNRYWPKNETAAEIRDFIQPGGQA